MQRVYLQCIYVFWQSVLFEIFPMYELCAFDRLSIFLSVLGLSVFVFFNYLMIVNSIRYIRLNILLK